MLGTISVKSWKWKGRWIISKSFSSDVECVLSSRLSLDRFHGHGTDKISAVDCCWLWRWNLANYPPKRSDIKRNYDVCGEFYLWISPRGKIYFYRTTWIENKFGPLSIWIRLYCWVSQLIASRIEYLHCTYFY